MSSRRRGARAPGLGKLRSCACCALLLAIPTALASALVSAAEPDVEQQIKAGLVPPVLVKQESPQLTPLAARMEALKVPAVSIAVIHEGKLEWAGGFGTLGEGGAPVSPDTLFQAGSISKAVTAAAVLHLVQTGVLDLDADIDRYLKLWKLSQSPLTDHDPVTLRELLSHSAGLTVGGFGGYETGLPLPTLVQVLNGEPPANNPPIRVDIAPGTTWRYSGGGYVVAQQALIDTIGKPFPELMREYVLAPFEMKHSSFQEPLPPDLLRRAAIPYGTDGAPIRGGPHVYPEMAAAGLWTTASDLARYAIGIQQALAGLSNRVLSQATAHSMLTPVRNKQGVPLKIPFNKREREQGLGFLLGGKPDHPYFEHAGGDEGYQAYVMAYERGDGAAIMTNSNNGFPLIDEVMRTIAYTYKWPDFAPPLRTIARMDPKQFDRYVGAYASTSGDIVAFWRNNGHLESRVWGHPVSEVFPISSREYFQKTADTLWAFTSDRDSVNGVRLIEEGHEQLLKRVEAREGRTVVEESIDVERRIQNAIPAPGGEKALRTLFADIARGEPNYGQLVPEFANGVRQELPGLQKTFGELGRVQSASFQRVLSGGEDVYTVTFEHGTRGFQILLAPDGRVQMVKFYP